MCTELYDTFNLIYFSFCFRYVNVNLQRTKRKITLFKQQIVSIYVFFLQISIPLTLSTIYVSTHLGKHILRPVSFPVIHIFSYIKKDSMSFSNKRTLYVEHPQFLCKLLRSSIFSFNRFMYSHYAQERDI